jgi:hypothetical protein
VTKEEDLSVPRNETEGKRNFLDIKFENEDLILEIILRYLK